MLLMPEWRNGGELMELLGAQDIHMGVPHNNAACIQEVYNSILHCLCDTTDCLLLGVD